MDISVFPPNELRAALGALRALEPQPSARALQFLRVLAQLHGTQDHVEPAPLASHAEVARVIVDPQHRKRLVQLAAISAMVDGVVRPEQAQRVAALASALRVSDPAIAILGKLADRRPLATRIAIMRRIMGRFLPETLRTQGLEGVRQIAFGMLGLGRDPATAMRYRALGSYPRGTLGRELHDHCRRNGFPLPGERGAIPERMFFHDIGHLLSGYDTDPAGEIQQAAFQAGFMRQDGFAFLFFGIVQFHLGVRVTPVAKGEVGYFDIDKVLTALARGAACKLDLSDRWSFWPLAHEPLDRVRKSLGIPPLQAAA